MSKETELSDVQMPVVAWVEPEYEDYFGCVSIQAYRSETPGWEPLVRQSDAQAALVAKDAEIARLNSRSEAEVDADLAQAITELRINYGRAVGVLLSIEKLLLMPGMTAAVVLDENSPVRDALRDVIAKVNPAASAKAVAK